MATTVISSELQERVTNELVWDPQVTSSNIGVTSNDGVVTLNGFVNSYAERLAAEEAALRVQGTRGVANELIVRLAGDRIDPDIAKDAVHALSFNQSVPKSIKVTVRNGHLTLDGSCEWQFQRRAAENAVQHIPGVKGVTNYVVVKPHLSAALVREKIEAALRRNAIIDSKNIRVLTSGSKVTLSGRVPSYAERREAEHAAWAAPGVSEVVNDVIVEPMAI
jgi:osmotically-inducible protein OsmY